MRSLFLKSAAAALAVTLKAFGSPALAEPTIAEALPGGMEVVDTFMELKGTCDLDEAKAVAAAVQKINAIPERANAAPIVLKENTLDAFLRAYGTIEVKPPNLNERALAKLTIEAILGSMAVSGEYVDREEHARQYGADMGATGLTVKRGKTDAEQFLIWGVLPGSPADRAGLRRGDVILSIDGAPASGYDLSGLFTRLRGPLKSPVKLGIRRKGEKSQITVEVVRDRILRGPVSSRMERQIGVIVVDSFGPSGSADTMANAINAMTSSAAPPKALILDLRANAGGNFDEIRSAADFLLDGGEIGSVVGDPKCRATPAQKYKAWPGGVGLGLPMAVLIDDGTGSGTEFLAAALAESRGAITIGQNTSAKADIRTVLMISPRTAVIVATGNMVTPKGVVITGNGVVPTIVTPEATFELDYPFEKAIEVLTEKTGGMKPKPSQ